MKDGLQIDAQKANKMDSLLILSECEKSVDQKWISLQLPRENFVSQPEVGIVAKLQRFLKNYGSLYYTLLKILGPIFPNPVAQSKIAQLLNDHDSSKTVINLGSGPEVFWNRKDIINVDMGHFSEVDLIADATHLPIKPESVDLIINVAMLEHTKNPASIVAESKRVLKPGGKMLLFVPFMQPFHAAPEDYFRWTQHGLSQLLSDFKEKTVFMGAGPTSGFLWVFQEWLAILLSFGSKTLHDIVLLIALVLFCPIKILDFILVYFPGADRVCSGFYVIVEKD